MKSNFQSNIILDNEIEKKLKKKKVELAGLSC
jgi:hypothetical protein